MSTVWLVTSIVLFVFEAITFGLVCIWFAIGALGGAVAAFFTDSLFIQLLTFVIVSAVSFLAFKPFFKNTIHKSQNGELSSTDKYIGKVAEVVEDIDYEGRVLVGDVSWIAKSSEIIKKGEKVKIISAEGNVLEVEKF